MNKHFIKVSDTFVREAEYLRMHPADIGGAREIAEAVARVSRACSALRSNMPILIPFDWARLNTDVLVHIFKFCGKAVRARLATMCRRFHCIYYRNFVKYILLRCHQLRCFSPHLGSLEKVDVHITMYDHCVYAPPNLEALHRFLSARRYTHVPEFVENGRIFTNSFTVLKNIIPHITLDANVTLPFNTTYLSVVGRVYGVKELTLVLQTQEIGYFLFPPFDGLETLQIIHHEKHDLFAGNFYTFFRNVYNIAMDLKPKILRLSPPLLQKFEDLLKSNV